MTEEDAMTQTNTSVNNPALKLWRDARARRIAKRTSIAFAGFMLLFGLVGYFWLPGYAKSQLETALSTEFKRPVTVERIVVSPYALAVTVEGFKVGDVASVGRLRVNLSSASLFRLMPIVSEVTIDQPRLHLVRESETRLNISDLLDQWAAKPASNGPPQQFSVSNITLNDGQVEWVDQVVGETQTVSQIHLGVPFLANTPSQEEVYVQPAFSAHLNGADFNLSGKVRPFAAGQDAMLAVELDDFDLTRISGYLQSPLALESALLSTKLQVQFQRRNGGADSLNVTGDLAVKKLKGTLTAQKLGIDVPLLSLGGIRADVFGQKVAVQRIALQSQADAMPSFQRADSRFLRWQELSLDALAVDMKAHMAQVGGVKLATPELDLARTPAGKLDIVETFATPAPTPPAKPAKVEKTEALAPAWNWSLDKFVLESGKLQFVDQGRKDAHALTLADVQIETGKLTSLTPPPIPVKLKATVNEQGSLAAEGSVTLAGQADLKLDAQHFDLVALQGWATEGLNAVLTRGDASFTGDIHAANGQVKLDGDVALNDFNVLDRVNAEDMLRWKLLRVDKLALNTQPFAVNIGEVSLRDFYAQLLVNSKGQLNLKGIVNKPAEPTPAPASSIAAAPPAPVATAPVKPAPALPVRIGKITLANGEVDFNDEFIKPNYAVRLSSLKGNIGTLAAGKQSSVEISGKVDKSAPLHIAGWVDPFASLLSLNLQASARGLDLPTLSGYSGHYLGYPIEKGKLSVDVSYLIDKGELKAQNKIFLDQLTLGEKLDNPSVLDIPIRLAIALLKNSRGEIDLDLPLSGSLNDPQFSIGGIVVKVLVNLVVKAVTAPFALLGSLFGGGEDLSNLAFIAGSSRLTPDMEGKLQSLGKAMADRPGLKMEITGFADVAADRAGLKHELMLRKLKARKLADSARRGKSSVSVDEVVITPEEYPDLLEKVYGDADIKGKPRNAIGMQKSIPVAEMEALLLANIAVTDADLTELADARGRAVQDWLTSTGSVAVERVFLLSSHVGPAEKDLPPSRVAFSIR